MAENVSFPSRKGDTAHGVIALPPGDARAPAVVLLQEWWGVNAHIRSLVDRLAAEGFVVLAPDLYHGQTTRDAGEAQRLMTELKWSVALEEIAGAAEFLKRHPRSTGKVGVTGFCMGGAGALLTASNLPGLSAAVAFYGIPPAQYVDWKSAEPPPIQAHFSSRDQWARAESAAAIRDALVARGREFELHVYDAEHAFVNDTRPEVYDAESARVAWGRMAAFFHKHLGA
jgi:carboxymethylenebutenolidase